MFSKLKQFNPVCVKHKLVNFHKFYCSDELKSLPAITIEKDERTRILKQLPATKIVVQSYEQCAKFEEKVLKQVLVEKEKDATLQIRLSKECKTFLATPIGKSGAVKCPALHLDHISLQHVPESQDWSTYPFDHFHSTIPEKLSPERPYELKSEVISGSVNKDLLVPPSITGAVPRGGSTDGGPVGNRPIRQEPGKVIFTFIPEEWWRVFIPKTGVTGFGTFMFTFWTFLVSKEYYVLEHYYYHGLGALCVWAGGIKYIGPLLAKILDKEVDQYETAWNEGRVHEKNMLDENIVNELFMQYQMDGQLMLNEAKRENVKLQLEEEYRRRQMKTYIAVKQRLDYHVELELIKQRIQQKNLVEYVTREVRKAITPDMESKLIYYSIDRIVTDLKQAKEII